MIESRPAQTCILRFLRRSRWCTGWSRRTPVGPRARNRRPRRLPCRCIRSRPSNPRSGPPRIHTPTQDRMSPMCRGCHPGSPGCFPVRSRTQGAPQSCRTSDSRCRHSRRRAPGNPRPLGTDNPDPPTRQGAESPQHSPLRNTCRGQCRDCRRRKPSCSLRRRTGSPRRNRRCIHSRRRSHHTRIPPPAPRCRTPRPCRARCNRSSRVRPDRPSQFHKAPSLLPGSSRRLLLPASKLGTAPPGSLCQKEHRCCQ
jgi:hypothetical protein